MVNKGWPEEAALSQLVKSYNEEVQECQALRMRLTHEASDISRLCS